MYELLKIIFLGKSLLLTPNPIDIGPKNPFVYKGNLTLLNSNANIEIDLTKSGVKNTLNLNGITDQNSDRKLEDFLKKCPIQIYGFNERRKIFFGTAYLSMVSRNDISLNFSPIESNIHEIDELHIQSSCKLDRVRVLWKNYGK